VSEVCRAPSLNCRLGLILLPDTPPRTHSADDPSPSPRSFYLLLKNQRCRAGRVAQMVVCIPSKYEALSSNPSPPKNEQCENPSTVSC
jgi:hypothetical protein